MTSAQLDRADKASWYAVYATSAVAIGHVVVHTMRAVTFPFPLDYGEGPLLGQARALALGQSIYRADLGDYPFTIANYPPLYPSLLALAGKLSGLSYVTARSITLAAVIACASLVAAIVHTATRDRRASLVGGALFLASPYVVFWATLARVDFVALAFSLGALLVVARGPQQAWVPLAAALLALLAALTRQSHLLAAPMAVTGALLVQRGRRAAVFALSLAGAVVAAVLLLDRATRGGFLFDTVTANANRFSPSLLGFFLIDLLCTTAPLLVLAVVFAARGAWPRRDLRALLVLFLIGSALSALTIGKVGSHVNYLLELVAAAAVLAGLAVARPAGDVGPRWKGVAVVALVAAQCAWLSGFALLRPENMPGKLRLRAEFERLRDVVAAEPGPVLADEAMGVLVIANHDVVLQPFELSQLARQGLWDQSKLVADLRAGRFGLVLVNDGPATPEAWTRERWTPEMLAAIHDAYSPTGALAEATLYRPRGAARSP